MHDLLAVALVLILLWVFGFIAVYKTMLWFIKKEYPTLKWQDADTVFLLIFGVGWPIFLPAAWTAIGFTALCRYLHKALNIKTFAEMVNREHFKDNK